MSDFTLYAVVNYKTCGWCKKFRPVLESNVKAMNATSQKKVVVVELDTPEGQSLSKKLKFSGGIPCLIATKGETEVYKQPGYQDAPKFANTLVTLFSTYA